MRCSAFVPNHHEGIVSREIANAVKLLSGSNYVNGIPDISVVEKGGLKGFVSVCPWWSGVDRDMYLNFSRSAYKDEEFIQIQHEAQIINGEKHSKILSMEFTGYEVPNSAFFINASTPTLTFTNRRIKINKRCYEKFEDYNYIEILYHPLLQAIVIRNCEADCTRSIALTKKDGKMVTSFFAAPFCSIVYEQMDWIKDYRFRFRGVVRKRGNQTAMLFFLDEPQILVGKGGVKVDDGVSLKSNYIPYRNSDLNTGITKDKIYQFGMSYAIRKKRDEIIKTLSEHDISECGERRVNPFIGEIPTRQEILKELDELLLSM